MTAVALEPSGSAPRPRWHRLLAFARPAIGLLVIVLLLRAIGGTDLRRAARAVRQAGWWLTVVPLPTLLAMSLDAWAWQRILNLLGQAARWRPLLELRLSVEALVLALPGGSVAGEGAKLALLERRLGVPYPTGAASLALTKALLMAASSLYLATGAVWFLLRARGGTTPSVTSLPALLGLGGAIVTGLLAVALLYLLRGGTAFLALARRLAASPIRPLQNWIAARQAAFDRVDARTGTFFAAPWAKQLRCFWPFVAEWLIEGAETFIILRCLSAPVGIGDALIVDGVGSLLRVMVFFVPAGLGFQDGAQVALLGMLGIGDAPATGAAFIFIKRSKELFWIVTGTFFLAVRRDLWQRTRSTSAS